MRFTPSFLAAAALLVSLGAWVGIARAAGNPSWNWEKCPAGYHGTGCTSVEISGGVTSVSAYRGTYVTTSDTCTGRPVYKHASAQDKFIIYVQVRFWPYISIWMVTDTAATDNTPGSFCTNGVTSIPEFGAMYLESSALSPAHNRGSHWSVETNNNRFDQDTTVRARCTAGCSQCAGGTYSQGCKRLYLSMASSEPFASRFTGEYTVTASQYANHDSYARWNGTGYDAFLLYLAFRTYSVNGVEVFTEGFCLRAQEPAADTLLYTCDAFSPASRSTEPSSPAAVQSWRYNEPWPPGPRQVTLHLLLNPQYVSQMRLGCQPCESCPAGYFSVPGSTRCEACEAGRFAASAGSNSCAECSTGYFQPTAGQTSCAACPTGYFGDVTSSGTYCLPCAAGNFASNPGSEACQNCPRGYFQPAQGAPGCLVCKAGTYSTLGSLSCSDCSAGSFSSGAADSCMLCSVGRFQPTGSQNMCLECSAGRYSTSVGGTGCFKCSSNTYIPAQQANFEQSNSSHTCTACPLCSLSGRHPCGACSPKVGFRQHPGFWRDPALGHTPPTLDTRLFRCAVLGYDTDSNGNIVETTACDVVNGTQVCRKGYGGFICSSCVQGYGHGFRRSTCSECVGSQSLVWLKIVIVTLVVLTAMAYIVKRKTRKKGASLERVFLVYLQLAGYAASVAVNWPGYVAIFLGLESSAGNANTFSHNDVECAMEGSYLMGSWFFTYATLVISSPFLFLILMVGGNLAIRACVGSLRSQRPKGGHSPKSKGSVRIDTRSRIISISVIVMYVMWGTCILATFQLMFGCSTYADGSRRLKMDKEQKCYEAAHLTIAMAIGMPALLLYAVGAPCLIGLILWTVRNDLTSYTVVARWGFLLAGYRRDRFFWEMVNFARRLSILTVAVALDDVLHLQIAVISALSLLFLILHKVYKPYADDVEMLLSRAHMSVKRGQTHRHATPELSIEACGGGTKEDVVWTSERSHPAKMRGSDKDSPEALAAHGKLVSRMETFSLTTNFLTFYLALFIVGDAGESAEWQNFVGVVLILVNIAYITFFAINYRETFTKKVVNETRNISKLAHAVRKRFGRLAPRNKRGKPPSREVVARSVRIESPVRSSLGVDIDGVTERALPTGWSQHVDETSGYVFWMRPDGEPTWDPPEGYYDPNQERLSTMEIEYEAPGELEEGTSHM